MDCPTDIDFITCDTVAECYDGISSELCRKLWNITSGAEQAGTAQPLGGDGSNGTTEEPIVGGDYDNTLKHAWKHFNEAERAEIVKALG